MKRQPTRAEREHMSEVASLGCLLCGSEASLHHPRFDCGMGQRESHWLVIPLCWECHQGPSGIHGDKSIMRASKLSELGMLEEVNKRLALRRKMR